MISIIITNFFVMLMPGLSFMVTLHTAILYGKKPALSVAKGITTAVTLHAVLAYLGTGVLITTFPKSVFYVKIFGGLYLFMLASMFLFSKDKQIATSTGQANKNSKYFIIGFLTDLTNPYIFLFYVTQFATIHIYKFTNVLILFLVIFIINYIWFSIVALVFSAHGAFKKFQNYIKIIKTLSITYIYYNAVILCFIN